MKIPLSKGYVLMLDFLTHKASRDYQSTLLKGTKLKASGRLDAHGRDIMEYDVDPNNSDLANESLALNLIEKVIVISEDGTEAPVEASHEWLDRLPESDYRKIEKAAFEIKTKKDEETKKT